MDCCAIRLRPQQSFASNGTNGLVPAMPAPGSRNLPGSWFLVPVQIVLVPVMLCYWAFPAAQTTNTLEAHSDEKSKQLHGDGVGHPSHHQSYGDDSEGNVQEACRDPSTTSEAAMKQNLEHEDIDSFLDACPLPEGTTTLLIRNVPARNKQDSLLRDFQPDGSFDFLYVPYNFKRGCTTGFATQFPGLFRSKPEGCIKCVLECV
jgi:hypothetical protein